MILYSCSSSEELQVCEPESNLISSYTNPEGVMVQMFDTGNTYISNDNCTLAEMSFEPGFYSKNYVDQGNTTFIKVNDTDLFEVNKNFNDDFESYDGLNSLILKDISKRDKIYTSFALQSPSTPTVADYNELRTCLLQKSCNFIDNRIYLTQDPDDSNNQVLAFYSVAPSQDMVVAKASIGTGTILFKKGEVFWFEMKIYIEDKMPQTVADFESSFIKGYPGPRISISNNQIEVENKFGAKLKYNQDAGENKDIPIQQWVKIKAHFKWDTENGVIQVWQDDNLIIDAIGRNIPFDIWILNSLEIGISATQQQSTMLVDDLRFSNFPL